MTKLTSRDYYSLLIYFINIGFSVVFFAAGLYGAIRPIAANIAWLIIWSGYLSLLISLPVKALDVKR